MRFLTRWWTLECRHTIATKEHARSRGRSRFASWKLGRESGSRARYEIKEKELSSFQRGGMATGTPGDHPRRRALSRGVLSPIRAYSTPQARATPAIMRSFHPSTNGKHRVLASSPFRLRLSRPCHSDQTPRGTRSSCTCIRGAARARCARESGRLRESLRERGRGRSK